MAQLICRDLSLGYEGKALIEHLNFSVEKGDYLCIVGENGAGKTTLLKTLLHLHAPLHGTIEAGDGLRKDEIGYLPQQTLVQRDFPASVWEIVLSGCQRRGKWHLFYSSADKQLARQSMEKMNITNLSKRCYRELSGGQQQRVLLARALCATQKLLLLDEPVSGLDPKATEEMYALIRSLNQEGITIVMISHDLSAVASDASHVLHLGKKIFFGTKQDYLKSENVHTFDRKGDE